MKPAALVFLGGGLGAALRWAVISFAPGAWSIVAVNLAGSMALGAVANPALGLGADWRLLLGTGALGGFTTYSTFNLDLLTALQDGRPGRALTLATATLFGGLAAGAVGWWVAGRWSA